ncbi:MAG: CsgG/HfaB family protein [Rubrivivax sp.]|jgi:curli biogenesis system outer membrane secretion channel CsgG|nr:CsgG/HfaB family protein [Rubrivivax sp.]
MKTGQPSGAAPTAQQRHKIRLAAGASLASLWPCLMLQGCVSAARVSAERPAADTAAVVRKPLPRLTAGGGDRRVAVAVAEVQSGIPDISARGATEMFKTALIQSGRFRVFERNRLAKGVLQEKQLNAAGQTTGKTSERALTAAEYIFQADITALTNGASQRQTGLQLGGLQLGVSGQADVLGLDISIAEVGSGELVDAVHVRRPLQGSAVQVSGIGALVQQIALQKGRRGSPYSPDVQHQSSRKDSLDAALREALEAAVRELTERFRP